MWTGREWEEAGGHRLADKVITTREMGAGGLGLVLMLVSSVRSDSFDPMNCSPGSSVPGFSREEYWSGLLCSSPRNLPNSGIEPGYPALQTDSLSSELLGKPQSGHRGKVFGF